MTFRTLGVLWVVCATIYSYLLGRLWYDKLFPDGTNSNQEPSTKKLLTEILFNLIIMIGLGIILIQSTESIRAVVAYASAIAVTQLSQNLRGTHKYRRWVSMSKLTIDILGAVVLWILIMY